MASSRPLNIDGHTAMATKTHPAPTTLSVIKRFKQCALRIYFGVGSRLAPECIINQASRRFITPQASSRHHASAAMAMAACLHKTIHVQRHCIATYTWGDPSKQPYVLLAHGWSGFGLQFLPWVEHLRAKGYAVVAFDQPGHGLSDGRHCALPRFISTLRQVGNHFGEPAVAICHGLGAAAMTMTLDAAWRPHKLIYLAPCIDLYDVVERFADAITLHHRVRDRLHASVQDPRLDSKDLHLRWLLYKMSQPGLVVHDLRDEQVPWEEGECYVRHWPTARLYTTAGLGYSRLLHNERVIEASMAFLRGERIGVNYALSAPSAPAAASS